MNMKTLHRAVRPYEAPEAEIFEFKLEEGFLFDSFTGSNNNKLNAADDLVDIETDAGNAIWN